MHCSITLWHKARVCSTSFVAAQDVVPQPRSSSDNKRKPLCRAQTVSGRWRELLHGRMMDSWTWNFLVVPDCPHERAAAVLLRSALDDIGLTAESFQLTVIDTSEAAERRGFVGSPAILLNGIDAFETPGEQVSVACRLYSGADGLPDVRALRQALKRAAFEGARG